MYWLRFVYTIHTSDMNMDANRETSRNKHYFIKILMCAFTCEFLEERGVWINTFKYHVYFEVDTPAWSQT